MMLREVVFSQGVASFQEKKIIGYVHALFNPDAIQFLLRFTGK